MKIMMNKITIANLTQTTLKCLELAAVNNNHANQTVVQVTKSLLLSNNSATLGFHIHPNNLNKRIGYKLKSTKQILANNRTGLNQEM